MKKSLSVKNCQSYCKQKSVKKEGSKRSLSCVFFRKSFSALLIIMIVSCGIAYIFQVNSLATMGNQIKEKESLLEELKDQNKTLEIKVAQLRSAYNYEDEREDLKMRKPETISFVKVVMDSEVALK